MDKKIVAVAAVLIIVVAAVGVYFVMNDDDDKEINILGRVNTEGSGLFLNKDAVVTDYFTKQDTVPAEGQKYIEYNHEYYVFNTETWGAKVFGTPGAATIQHIQLQDFVINVLGLKFEQYIVGTELSKDTVYFEKTISSFDKYENSQSPLTGAYIWEAQYSLAIAKGYKGLITSNEMFPGHTCCVIAGSHDYTSNHQDETVRFLAAYVEAVDALNAAIKNPGSEEYNKAMVIAIDVLVFPTNTSDEQQRAIVENAWKIITYTAYDDATAADPLSALKGDIANLADDLYTSKNVNFSATDLGFKDSTAFAEKYVDSSFMKKAIDYKPVDGASKFKVKVAVIGGDIHQLAIHYGIEMKIFESYGVTVDTTTATNGPAVSVAIENGEAQFGFIGAPPMTIKVMNSKLVTQ